jgi:hypothetical protein
MLLAIPLCAAICALVVRAEEQERQVLSCSVIKEAIDALPDGGGRVVLAANSDYICTESIPIKKNNVHLIGGAGTWIRLADGVNQPVVLVGDPSQPPTAVVEGVVLSGLNIDGNRLGQEFECNKGACEGDDIHRNNGITLRKVKNAPITQTTIRDAVSGGVVTEHGCENLILRDLRVSGSGFDALALYATAGVVGSNLILSDNLAAGFSVDQMLSNSTFSGLVISRSGSVAMFLRWTKNVVFNGVVVDGTGLKRDQAEPGVFLADVPGEPDAAPSGFCNSSFHRRTRDPLLPPLSAVISNCVASG